MTDHSQKGLDMADLSPADVAAIFASIAAKPVKAIQATPYVWTDPKKLPRRKWLAGRYVLASELSLIVGNGGGGKSTFATALALALASGKNLVGQQLHRGPQTTWLTSLEDSREELERQIAAAQIYYGISPQDYGKRLFVNSGLDQPLCLATEGKTGFVMNEKAFAEIERTIVDNGISVMIIDPFVSCHALPENSNEAMNGLAKRLKKLAGETGCAIIIVHHARKDANSKEVTVEHARGASALVNAARVVLTLNPMSKEEAEEAGIDPQLRYLLVRVVVGKSNRAPKGAATWFELKSQDIGNDSAYEPSDTAAVAVLWTKPEILDGVTPLRIAGIQQKVANGEWRENVQAKEHWVGNVIAEILGLSLEKDKPRIKKILNWLVSHGHLEIEYKPGKNGKSHPYAVVGKLVDPSAVSPTETDL